MGPLHIIDTDLADPAYTAAIDETLLRSADGGGPPVLHLYRRSPPAVTLGYFLDVDENVDVQYCRENGIKILRRMSGGGAIYTDQGQLIYSLTGKDIFPDGTVECFELVCGAVAEALRTLGCDCRHVPVNDIVHDGRKLSGSALFQRGRAKLMHGTVIVELDREAMFRALKVSEEKLKEKALQRPGDRVTSLTEALGGPVPMDELKMALATALGRTLDMSDRPYTLSQEEKIRAEGLVKEKYGNDDWNFKKNK